MTGTRIISYEDNTSDEARKQAIELEESENNLALVVSKWLESRCLQ